MEEYSKCLQQNSNRVHLLSPSPELTIIFLLNSFSPPPVFYSKEDYIYSAEVY